MFYFSDNSLVLCYSSCFLYSKMMVSVDLINPFIKLQGNIRMSFLIFKLLVTTKMGNWNFNCPSIDLEIQEPFR